MPSVSARGWRGQFSVVVKFGFRLRLPPRVFSSSPTMSRMLHSVCVTPAFIAGDMRIVRWIRAKL